MNTPEIIVEQLEKLVGASLTNETSEQVCKEIDKTCEVINNYFKNKKENDDDEMD